MLSRLARNLSADPSQFFIALFLWTHLSIHHVMSFHADTADLNTLCDIFCSLPCVICIGHFRVLRFQVIVHGHVYGHSHLSPTVPHTVFSHHVARDADYKDRLHDWQQRIRQLIRSVSERYNVRKSRILSPSMTRVRYDRYSFVVVSIVAFKDGISNLIVQGVGNGFLDRIVCHITEHILDLMKCGLRDDSYSCILSKTLILCIS